MAHTFSHARYSAIFSYTFVGVGVIDSLQNMPKSRPSKLSIAYLGPQGSHCHEAAAYAFADTKLRAAASIQDAFEQVARGRVAFAVVPFENIIEGPVNETLDLLWQHVPKVALCGMMVRPIEHALGALPAAKHISQVWSKDQALAQCSRYLQKHFANSERVATSSTSGAIEHIAARRLTSVAAIGSVNAIERYGLRVLDRNIGNIAHNKTRFAVLARADQIPDAFKRKANTTAVIVYPHRNRIGLLESIVDVISRRHGINMWAIHSRPDQHGLFRFFFELEGALGSERIQACLRTLADELNPEDVEIRALGSYARAAFVEAQLHTIGIVGGTGAMGQWFTRFFEAAGYKVLISGRRTPLTYEQCAKRSDVVLINVPIADTPKVIRKVAPFLRHGALIVDNTSIKGPAVAAMLRACRSDVEVLGMHTVFGPRVAALKGENVIFTPTERSRSRAKEFENIFYKHGARITHTSPEHHDKQMAFHQNLIHFTKAVLAELVASEFKSHDDMLRYASPNSRQELAVIARVLSGDSALYRQIQEHNAMGPAMVEHYAKLVERARRAIKRGDFSAFEHSLQKSAQRFDDSLVKSWLEHYE